MNADTLIARIAEAFPTVPTPTKDTVLYEGAYPGESELEEIRVFFGGRAWNSLTPQDIFRFRHALSFFSPLAFAYYAPAWMTCSLLEQRTVDTAVENLTGALGEADRSLWTQEQQFLICRWLFHFSRVSLRPVFDKAVANLGCHNASSSCNSG
jgi:hypothetical protein